MEASGEDAVTLYLKEDQETLCPFKENTISPDSYEFFKNKTMENWQTTLSECQVFCMKLGSKCNFVHFNSEQLSCSWGKVSNWQLKRNIEIGFRYFISDIL